MKTTALQFTYSDYRSLPENGKRYQLVDGDLLMMAPAPSYRHQAILRNLEYPLLQFVERNRLGTVLFAPLDVVLSDTDVVQPELLFLSTAHRDRIVTEGVRGAPDLVVEILSPSTRELDLTVKRKLYARYEIPEYWIVDPDAQTIAVYRLAEDPEKPLRTYQAGQSLQSPLLPGLMIPLNDVFRA